MFDLIPAIFRLSVFPTLLSFSLLAPFLLRIMMSVFLTRDGFKVAINSGHSSRARSLGGIKIALGFLLFIGFWTQAAALASAVIAGYHYTKKQF